MTRNDVRAAVQKAVCEAAGLEPQEFADDFRPIGGIPDFDSLSGVEATAAVSQFLDYDLPLNLNPFIHKAGRRAASISEAVDAVFDCVRVKVSTRG